MSTQDDGSLHTPHYQLFNLIESTISAVIESAGPEDEYWEAASAVLKAGWSKPYTVNSVEELEALPGLSVIRDADLFDSPGDILEKWYRPTGWQWMRVGSVKFRASNEINLPATVIFIPEATA